MSGEFDFSQFQQDANSGNGSMEAFLGHDIFGLLNGPDDDEEDEEEEEQEEPKYVKFHYSETKKRKLLDAFKTTYVNDYGKADPYHVDSRDDLASQVRNEIHAIYGNRTIVDYIIAMRKVFKVYQEMYQKSVQRMIMDLPSFIEMVVSGEIPAPFNHPRVRTNVPDEILMRYIYNEKLDPEEIRKFADGGSSSASEEPGGMIFDLTNVEQDWNTPVEYQIMDERIQRKVIQSWLEGKPCLKGLDKNERNMVQILTQIYDQVGVEDPEFFKFDLPLKRHPDIISWKNTLFYAPDHIRLRHFTERDLEERRIGNLIREIMYSDSYSSNSPEITIPQLIERMERHNNEMGHPISGKRWLSIYRLYTQGIISVKKGKYGQETYVYRDKSRSKKDSINAMIRDIEKKAEYFTDITRELNDRFLSLPYSKLIHEIQHEQEMIHKYGLSYYTEGD